MILARKYIANGIINAVWISFPISVSKLLVFVSYFDKMSWVVFVYSRKLVLGKLTHNVCVLYTHPMITLISSNASSDFVFYYLIISSLGTGYFWANGLETEWIVSGISAVPLALFFPISGMTVMQSSRYMSIFPWGSTGILTDKGFIWSNLWRCPGLMVGGWVLVWGLGFLWFPSVIQE